MGAEGEGGWECFFDSDEFVRSAGAYVRVGWDQGEFFEFVLLNFLCQRIYLAGFATCVEAYHAPRRGLENCTTVDAEVPRVFR